MGLFATNMIYQNDTIFALSTPPGKSAVALFRFSGPNSYELVKKFSSNMPAKSHIAKYNKIKDNENETIDQTITTFYKAPKSFTGEDMVEVAFHGSNAVIKKILEIFGKQKDLRMAKPGEFTRRAFENNKLDLTQVEAIADIVEAETEIQRKQAISHLSGFFFKSTKDIYENLKKILADIEAIIDFTEEDLPPNLLFKIKEQIENNILKINKIIAGSSVGISIRDGFVVAILGKPNTGKSSFINNISGKEMAIVTSEPGTTRDLIESFVDIDGYPIKFVDTAGIRETKDMVEKIGVEKALLISKEASLNIVFIQNEKDLLEFSSIKSPIFVKSKQDLFKKPLKDEGFYNISSVTGYGIKDVLELVIKKIIMAAPNEKNYISRERHLSCLKNVVYHLECSKEDKLVDLFAEDIRQSVKSFSSLFGKIDIEDILDIIFSDFCIGK